MKILAKKMDDRFAQVAKSSVDDASITRMSGISCEGDVISSEVFLAFRDSWDKKYPNRPYLHIVGKCNSIKGALPYNISKISFGENNGIDVDFIYEFTDAEIAKMASKGLFRKEFKCPGIFFNNDFELPVKCEFMIIKPQDENDLPIVFAQIMNPHCIEISAKTSGYTLGDYFEPCVPETDFEDAFNGEPVDEHTVEVETQVDTTPEPEQAEEEEHTDETIEVNFSDSVEQDILSSSYANIRSRVDNKYGSLASDNSAEQSAENTDYETDGDGHPDNSDFIDEKDADNTASHEATPKSVTSAMQDMADRANEAQNEDAQKE